MSLLRVLHILGPMEVGGAQIQLLGLIRAARDREWVPSLCSLAPGPMLPAFRELGIPVMELERWGSPGLLRMAAVRRHLSAVDYDVVHAVLPFAGVYARVGVMGRRERPAVVLAERDVEPRGRALLLANRVLGRWTDAWVANSEAVGRATRRTHPVRPGTLTVLPNAIDRTVFFPAPPRPPARPRRVGSLGRLSHEKGHDVLIDAVARIDATDLEVCIAGTGPEEARLRAQASGLPVTFLGAVEPGAAVASYLRSLDVFVLPSRREGQPNALLEAQACGVPAVASDLAAVRESVAAAAARLVPPGDPAALARAIVDVLHEPAAGTRAREGVGAIMDFDQLAAGHREVFERAVGRARS